MMYSLVGFLMLCTGFVLGFLARRNADEQERRIRGER